MKRSSSIVALLLCTAAGVFAQKQGGPLPYNKEKLDSLFRSLPKSNLPFVLPAPKGSRADNQQNFEALYPGAAVINKTAGGIIYNMPLDNMAMLVPYSQQVDNMPGGHDFRQAPATRMPNPLYLSPSNK